MTTPPKARKFRLRAGEPLLASPPPSEDGFGADPYPTAGAPPQASDPQASAQASAQAAMPSAESPPPTDLAAIRAEGLTGRQLRLARRNAQRHGIAAESDIEAVRLLRLRGIDPFQRATVLELVQPGRAAAQAQASPAPAEAEAKAAPRQPGLPATQPAPKLPQPSGPNPGIAAPARPRPLSPEQRAGEIRRVQEDIARRRRRRMAYLFLRLAFFVFLPTAIAGWYYARIATPLFATTSQFVIQQSEAKAAGGLGSLFAGTQFATSQDSIAVQGYLQSRDAMLRLDRELGFRAHWSDPGLDALQRLAPDATTEAVYRTYSKHVKISYDPTEGIVKMEVAAADPALSEAFSSALIRYAEEQVDQLTQRLRGDQMTEARASYADAESEVLQAQERVLNLQQQLGVLDPVSENSALMSQITTFEVELAKKRLELEQLRSNSDPNAARVRGAEGDVSRLEALITELRGQQTSRRGSGESLAAVTGQLRIAEGELQTRQLMLSQAAQQMEVARIEANKQVRYLSTGVRPVAPDEPTYPRAFENTLVAFLIFGGLYLMLSLTASILREQVSV